MMSLYDRERGYDLFDDGEDTDSEVDNSSEDEIDIILHGTPEQRRKLKHLHDKQMGQQAPHRGKNRSTDGTTLQQDSSSEDEFEREMNAELNQNVNSLEKSRGKLAIGFEGSTEMVHQQATNPSSDNKNAASSSSAEMFYDNIYFDSDEEEDMGESTSHHKHAVISNDDLLYDPNMDDEDQKWVDSERRSHMNILLGKSKSGRKQKRPNSDALLDCPACMTTLCIDCQRHDTYKHQYRAMFVMNCVVDDSEMLQVPEEVNKKKKKKNKNITPAVDNPAGSTQSVENKDLFNPVRCTECNTVVGVIDNDEVYHFFNVLASHT